VDARAWTAFAWVVLVGSVGAYAFNNYALKRVDSSTVATFVFLQPLIGVTLAMILLGDRLTPNAVLGGVLVVAGVVLVTRSESRPIVPADVGGAARSWQDLSAPADSDGASDGSDDAPPEHDG
jgi:drug/metabolite transporter (DMT)-like permease